MYNVKKQDVKNYRMVKCTKSDQNRLMLQTFEEKVFRWPQKFARIARPPKNRKGSFSRLCKTRCHHSRRFSQYPGYVHFPVYKTSIGQIFHLKEA